MRSVWAVWLASLTVRCALLLTCSGAAATAVFEGACVEPALSCGWVVLAGWIVCTADALWSGASERAVRMYVIPGGLRMSAGAATPTRTPPHAGARRR